ncbi:MAG: hypothetical protein APR63_05535 [Desulfuromonas sp. SDB]|nr:MAG: hypothetical protein APR63_05535 [Desulfuromonas sp. SDB]
MADLNLKHKFDAEKCRHYLNENLTVLHCHHYATLFTQLAIDAKDIVDGTKILFSTSEKIFFDVLSEYFKNFNISDKEAKVEISSKMFSAIGLGKMNITDINENGGKINLPHSYVDEGWTKKWGKMDMPVNFIGCGYIGGMFSAIFNQPVQTYKVEETESIVSGADKSNIKITR